MYSSILRQRSRSIPDSLYTRIFTRSMGGGPRTFRGGLNKWQWKRLHEKKAAEKEKKLLQQEKQVYEARMRSEIRAKLWEKPDTQPTQFSPMSPKDHIKALADRFVKAGAEDLWNEKDGPLKPDVQSQSIRDENERSRLPSPPMDFRKLVSERHTLASSRPNFDISSVGCNNFMKSRSFSVMAGRKFRRDEGSSTENNYAFNSINDSKTKFSFKSETNRGNVSIPIKGKEYAKKNGQNQRQFKRNESSCSEDDSDFESKKDSLSPFVRTITVKREDRNLNEESRFKKSRNSPFQRKFKRKDSSSTDDDSDYGVEDSGGHDNLRELMKNGSSASLGKYDMKKTRRIPLKSLETELSFPDQVEAIRKELSKKKLIEEEREKSNEESIFYTQKRFDECGISPLTVKALSAAGYFQTTLVQEATLSAYFDGKDAIVKAKTGTGKTAAFLLPAIETVLKANTVQRVPPILALILCPTRELASQLAAEARALVKYHDGIGVQTLVGGTRFKLDQQRLESDPCQILIATPGRLLDHVENKSGISVRLMGLQLLILDEADHLLDLGFRKDVEKIVDCLPRKRQTLIYSATIPKEVRRVSQLVLKREHEYIDTVGVGCVETHAKVKQSYVVTPQELHFQVVYNLLKDHISRSPDYKVIVFCNTGMVTSLTYLLLREMKMNVRELHSRKPQLYRTRVSDEFKESKRLILVTSDVTSRGMNYPDVTLVIQTGVPTDREQYIHRLGRTGRENKNGEGIFLIAPWEKYFLEEIKDLPLDAIPSPHLDSDDNRKIDKSLEKIDMSVKEAAYHAWLGYYNSIKETGRDKTTLVELANQFCESIGLQKPPSLFRKTAVKMGLKDIPGIRIRK